MATTSWSWVRVADIGLGVDRSDGGGDHVLVSVVDRGPRCYAGQVYPAALPAGAGEHPGDRCLQPGMLVTRRSRAPPQPTFQGQAARFD